MYTYMHFCFKLFILFIVLLMHIYHFLIYECLILKHAFFQSSNLYLQPFYYIFTQFNLDSISYGARIKVYLALFWTGGIY